MSWQLLTFIDWTGPCSPSLCFVFNSPSDLVSENYDYLWCLLAYLFYCQKGIVLYFCMWPYYSLFYSLYVHFHMYLIINACIILDYVTRESCNCVLNFMLGQPDKVMSSPSTIVMFIITVRNCRVSFGEGGRQTPARTQT